MNTDTSTGQAIGSAQIPDVCTLGDVASVMRISMATAYRRQKLGLLRPFALDVFGGHPRYSGARLREWATKSTARYINGDTARPRVFGRKTA